MKWDESKHPRVPKGNRDGGRFAPKQGYSSTTGIISRILRRVGRLRLPDEQLPRSVGAKWRNHEIFMPDGTKAIFAEGTKLQNKEVFAGKGCKRKIDTIDKLMQEYPNSSPSNWVKVKATAKIQLSNGEIINAEVHWYEEPSVGKVKIKYKKAF